jgi:hypothetical protein
MVGAAQVKKMNAARTITLARPGDDGFMISSLV